ncbi:CgeB family protein [Megalodesulfovibrio gigas]|uniref:Putative CgeB family protein n=1 Tax=Megalodesulfovibrio gigas (strain ATCC 19364 / DSM 1382 / NCIMB 9332 / VKM B-1759) TaxID=1121448 RepID=T2GDA2_MEGG1|nr:glycosyltransferase [Megalodesulfovibrio gigas]AGW14293.1 putative CgeB family protein [Megalodesulfovibrio gigas DSM 1382 = ATCC 19364]
MTISRPLRVLVVQPMYGGSLPVARYAASGLRSLGHLVEEFDAPDFHSAFTALKRLRVTLDRLEHLENSFLQVVSQAILAKVETFRPDLVLALAQAPLSRQALRRLRSAGTATAMWFVEDFRLFTYWRAFAPLYDFFFVIQKEPFLTALQEIGVANASYLPLAADPAFHKPTPLTPLEQHQFGSAVSFLGAGYPNRREAFKHLLGMDFRLWGSDWEDSAALRQVLQRGGARIAPEEAVKIFNATAVNVNLHSSVKADPPVQPGDFVNPRTFELAACGAFQVVDARSLLPELYAPDELATFSTLQEMKDLIQASLADPTARQAMAAKARARTLAEHTYAARMQRLLEVVAERRPGWPADAEQQPGAGQAGAANPLRDLPPDLQAAVRQRLESLGAPPDAPFKDVIWRLRQQPGELGSLDTALLYLDALQRQYSGE